MKVEFRKKMLRALTKEELIDVVIELQDSKTESPYVVPWYIPNTPSVPIDPLHSPVTYQNYETSTSNKLDLDKTSK